MASPSVIGLLVWLLLLKKPSQLYFYFTIVEENLKFDIRKFYLRVNEIDIVVRTLSELKIIKLPP